jgi:Bacterial Ig-like domain (group 3)
MSSAQDHDVSARGRRGRSHRSRGSASTATLAGISLLATAALVVASQAMLASAAPAVHTARGVRTGPAPALAPPAGSTWIEGVITDQAAHGEDNVNVEAWPRAGSATAPVASSLTYGASPAHPRLTHGFFLLEVPSGKAYRIVFSAVGGKEDGDPFRMRSYGHRRPIAVRTAVAPGRIRDLGTVALARHGHVASKTKASPARAKVAAGKRATVHVRVTSRFVTHVTGKVVVRVAGRRLSHRLSAGGHGKVTFRLPGLHRAGSYRVTASYAGSGTVHRSKAKPVRLTVRR